MTRFIVLTFLFLGWGFYELSGGADFDPVATRTARLENGVVAAPKVARAPAPVPEVTRVSLNLVSVDKVLAPAPTPARTVQVETVQTVAADADAEIDAFSGLEEPPTIILPSLITSPVEVRPVDFDAPQPRSEAPAVDIRAVSGTRVNVRGGPGTGYAVIDSLNKGAKVEVLDDPGNGWVRLRPVDGGPMGWMADFLLTEG